MLFNSFSFLIFFPVTVACFFLCPHRYRWILLLIASYFFYMYWKVEYIFLILASTLIDYFVALNLDRTDAPRQRKRWLLISITANLGLLFTFKYFNFASHSINSLCDKVGLIPFCPILNVLLPVGISFYTFQTLSYTIDVYFKKQKAEKHFGIFALYVSFFPQLVAGPIERSTNLLPQFYQKKDFDIDRLFSGAQLMLWGFIKKLVLADNFATYVDLVYGNAQHFDGFSLLIATYCFALQIYYDFSGYTDIARGASRILGFELMENFRLPYLARSISDFWQRWHISLSTWFRDYLYIPLGGSRINLKKWMRNIMLVFMLSGLWHGANWTFLVWGTLHGCFYIIEKIVVTIKKKITLPYDRTLSSAWGIFSWVVVFNAVCFAWIFFRSANITDAFMIAGRVLSFWDWSPRLSIDLPAQEIVFFFLLSAIMEFGTIKQISKDPPLIKIPWLSQCFQWGYIYFWLFIMLIFGNFVSQQFVYFQF